MNKALLIVDVQNDFCKGGPLEVPQGEETIPIINSVMSNFPYIIATQDWHPANHKSFASQHENKNIGDSVILHGENQALWPDHCIIDSAGSEIHPGIHIEKVHKIVKKGSNTDVDSYSAFLENDGKTKTELSGWLKEHNITELYVAGLATDYCVKFSAIDAVKEGFKTYLIEDACRAVNLQEGDEKKSKEEMKNAGVVFVQSDQFA